jgi:UDP-2,4-diacetamido-2,4,6-trideoxy-beta-L-altropyranose hydrolase
LESNTNILIRADASAEIGLGHVMRCLCLQAALRPLGVGCCFAFRQMPAALQQQILAQGGRLAPLPVTDLAADAAALLRLAGELGAAAILLDGYRFDAAYQQALFRRGPALALLDDLNDRGRLYADLLINSLPHADQLGYGRTAPEARLLLGLKYVLLREEFRTAAPASQAAAERPRLLVNFGGSDILGLSLPVTRQLLAMDPELPITLITGSGFPQPQAATELAGQFPQLEHLHNCRAMARQFSRTGLALAAPGATIYELAACGVPAVLLICAANQQLSAAAHARLGWCRVFDAREEKQLAAALAETLQLWRRPQERNLLQEKTAGLLDGQGAERIARAICQLTRSA